MNVIGTLRMFLSITALAVIVSASTGIVQADESSDPSITVVVVDQQNGTGPSNGEVGIQAATVQWWTKSELRYISHWMGDGADDLSETVAHCDGCVVEGIGVNGRLWKNGAIVFGCDAGAAFREAIRCDTPQADVPGDFRGTGQHRYQTNVHGAVELPPTDTGWHWINQQ